MRKKMVSIVLGVALLVSARAGMAEEAPIAIKPRQDLSFKLEIQNSIFKGLKWLEKKQNPDGSWSQPEYPALTALVLTSFQGEPTNKYRAEQPEFIRKGYLYLLKNVQPDGGIYVKSGQMPMENYNTAVSMVALVMARDKAYESILKNARNYLVSLQNNGGIGYNKTGHSDMSNTLLALEALYYTKHLAGQDTTPSDLQTTRQLDWKSAIEFIQSCQNLPGYNKEAWASDDPQNKGGFVYLPGESKAGEVKLASGKVALRSYGSISYAGLLSYIYADLAQDDPRVKAVYEWLQDNYTVEENPGMGGDGLFYYYQAMAKALSLYGADTLTLRDGKVVNWRKDLASKLLALQNGEDGSWVNASGRWWEKDPVLVTSYVLITLEILHRGM
jgi:squalene-hopene/tetraprenyl-beta-curcumene cyclase